MLVAISKRIPCGRATRRLGLAVMASIGLALSQSAVGETNVAPSARPAIPAAAALSPLSPAASLLANRNTAAEPALHISYRLESRPLEKQDQVKPTSRNGTVVLGSDYFFVREGDTIKLFDFALRRKATIDTARNVFWHVSLFSDVGFRGYETRHRLILAESMKRAGITGSPRAMGDRFWMATELGIDRGEPIETLEIGTDDGGTLRATYQGETVATIRFFEQPLDDQYHGQLGHYLRYAVNLHPRIIDRMLQTRRLPSEMVTTSYEGLAPIETHIRFGPPVIEATPYPLDQAIRTDGSFPTRHDFIRAVLPIANAALRHDDWAIKGDPSTYTALIRRHMDEGSIHEALLVMLELQLVIPVAVRCQQAPPDDQTCAAINVLYSKIRHDDKARALLKFMTPQRAGVDLATAAKELEALQHDDLSAGHALALFTANHYADLWTGTGKSEEQQAYFANAIRLYYKAFQGNPYMACMYHDIGKLYFRGYSPFEAWFFWDTGRALPNGPGCHLLQKITAFEETLLRQHPEFF